jgi:hypothetical protein
MGKIALAGAHQKKDIADENTRHSIPYIPDEIKQPNLKNLM